MCMHIFKGPQNSLRYIWKNIRVFYLPEDISFRAFWLSSVWTGCPLHLMYSCHFWGWQLLIIILGIPSSLFFCGGGSLPVSCIVCRFFLGLLSFNAFHLCSSFLRERAWEINFWGLIYLKTLLLYPYLELFGLLRNLKLENLVPSGFWRHCSAYSFQCYFWNFCLLPVPLYVDLLIFSVTCRIFS